MVRTVLLPACILLAVFLSTVAEGIPQPSNVAELFNRNKPVKERDLLELASYVQRGDTHLKERLTDLEKNLKEQLEKEDSDLKTRMLDGESQVKEQLKETKQQLQDGDARLQGELDEDVAWLKEKVAKVQMRVKQDFEEERTRLAEELSRLRDALKTLQDRDQKCPLQTAAAAVNEDLQQQLSDVRADLSSTKQQLQTLQTQLNGTKQQLEATRTELMTNHQSLQSMLNRSSSFHDNSGSTFVRWGNTGCPENTSFVYTGVGGGSFYSHSGGGANYLCLGMEPQLDNKTAVPSLYSFLYGAEYEYVNDHHDQDVACSVCRAPQATTLMIPATLTCPSGWTVQYKGHLMSGYHGNNNGRTEYVCVDEIREHVDGGSASDNGALFYHVITKCGSLPCPPYADKKVVTCVVCSL